MAGYDEDREDYYDADDWYTSRRMFADPGSNSALRAASRSNPRNRPCPTCEHPNRLTPADVQRGYQCNSCADAMERGGEIDYYEGDEDLDNYADWDEEAEANADRSFD